MSSEFWSSDRRKAMHKSPPCISRGGLKKWNQLFVISNLGQNLREFWKYPTFGDVTCMCGHRPLVNTSKGTGTMATCPVIWSDSVVYVYLTKNLLKLRILATLQAKTAQISNFWIFWPVIQLIHRLFTSGQNGVCPMVKIWSIGWITGQIVRNLLILAVLASSVASILKMVRSPLNQFMKDQNSRFKLVIAQTGSTRFNYAA